jgi:hypothetical protein
MKRFLMGLFLVPVAGCSADFNLRPHDHYHGPVFLPCPQARPAPPRVIYSTPQVQEPARRAEPAPTPSAPAPTIELSPPEPDSPPPAPEPEKTGRIREERQPRTRVAIRGSWDE